MRLLKDLNPVLKSYLMRAVRDSFKRSPAYKQCKKLARVEQVKYKKDGTPAKRPAVFYRCAACQQLFKDSEVHVDHRDPVIPLYSSLNDHNIEQFIDRVWCQQSNLQVLCKGCHKVKTAKETKVRKQIKGK